MFNTVLTTDPSNQRNGNLRIKALNEYAKLYITKTTGEDVFFNYTIDFYYRWLRVKVNNENHWYPIKNILNIREENNIIGYRPSQEQ